MGWVDKVSLVLSGAWRRILGLREDLWHFAVKEHWRQHGLNAHRSVLIQGRQALSALSVTGPVWVDAFSVLYVEDDRRGEAGLARMRIGSRVYIGQHCNIRAGGGEITIGDNVLMGNGVSIVATNHGMDPNIPMINQPSRTDNKDVFVGSDVWIGAHAVLLPGCRVENGSIVAAGAVVTAVVLENTIFGGVPARKIGMRGS